MTATDVARAEGFTLAPTAVPIRTRAWRARGWWGLAAVFALIITLFIARQTTEDADALSTNNVGPMGARAAAEVLRDRGVDVHQISRLSEARISDPAHTTLAVALPSALVAYQLDSILSYPGDLVFIGADSAVIAAVDPSLTIDYSSSATLRAAGCADPNATAAERIESDGLEIRAPSSSTAEVCFAGADGAGPYVVIHQDGRTITLLTNASLPMNENLTAYGNAALTFRMLGAHERLVWYLGNPLDISTLTYTKEGSGNSSDGGKQPPANAPSADFLPPGTGNAMYALGLAVLVAGIWRGRRMGKLVTENLPVVIPSSETTRGRARLYRRARAYGRAAASLRAASAERMGRLLGIPRSGNAPALIGAVSRAAKRDPASVERLLYGPPPDGERAMMDLVQELDTLERQVHRP